MNETVTMIIMYFSIDECDSDDDYYVFLDIHECDNDYVFLDIDECDTDDDSIQVLCDSKSTSCNNTEGSYECLCKKGYSRDYKNLKKIVRKCIDPKAVQSSKYGTNAK